jgi:aspartate/methionine/tyrosine aminotransferase
MIDHKEMQDLSNYCREKDIRLISDEIYHGINYEKKAVSALETHAESLIINSFSKYFSMTGWRLGWMIVPEDLTRSVECLAQNMFISPPTLSQIAASAAFDCYTEAEENVKRYAKNRSILMSELPSSGLDKLAPADGAFYIYADVAQLTNDSVGFCKRMLEDIGVACTPGLDFDPERGGTTLRLSFAGTERDVTEACKRIKTWLTN